ncbi:hypothetical protein NC651_010149 [Populus alba x Populus x berolinensis]|nr:hypothetical protein NC651_010149 [Populus alba x Populus x berolinensis]
MVVLWVLTGGSSCDDRSVEGAMEGEVAVGELLVLVRGVGRLRWEELRERGVLVWLSEDDEGYDAVVLFLGF